MRKGIGLVGLTRALFFVFAEPRTEIVGAPDLFIDWGSTINLTCVIHVTPEPPAFVFWDHNETVSTTEYF